MSDIKIGDAVVVTGVWTAQAHTSGKPSDDDSTGATRVGSAETSVTHSAEGNTNTYMVTGFHGDFAALMTIDGKFAWPTRLLELVGEPS